MYVANYMIFVIATGQKRKSHTVFHKQLNSSVLWELYAHNGLERGKLKQFWSDFLVFNESLGESTISHVKTDWLETKQSSIKDIFSATDPLHYLIFMHLFI